jgi:hypothetical protein
VASQAGDGCEPEHLPAKGELPGTQCSKKATNTEIFWYLCGIYAVFVVVVVFAVFKGQYAS